MTNFERITKSPEELAKFLDDFAATCDGCLVREFCLDHYDLYDCESTFKAWLNEEKEL